MTDPTIPPIPPSPATPSAPEGTISMEPPPPMPVAFSHESPMIGFLVLNKEATSFLEDWVRYRDVIRMVPAGPVTLPGETRSHPTTEVWVDITSRLESFRALGSPGDHWAKMRYALAAII